MSTRLVRAMTDLVEYLFFRILGAIVCNLPFSAVGWFGGFLGTLAFRLFGFRKRLTLDNLRHAFAEMSNEELGRIALGAYRNYGISIMEMIWSSRQPPSRLCDLVYVNKPSVIEAAIAKDRGIVLVSAHFGSWELLIHSVRLQLGIPVHIIVQRQRNKRVDEQIDKGRRRHGNSTIPMGPSSREALTVLRNRGVLAALADQSGPKESLFVNFFGRPASTHRGVAAFSLKTGAPLVMVISSRKADGTYHAFVEEIDRTGIEGYSEENITELTRRHVATLERYIRRFPDHWLWMHKRWKHTEHFLAHHDDLPAS